ncbi:MurR/RpiR family transcriptional regulator [Spiroplasma endosymbiont of Tipula paludosa]|uniref:MurR/RpiR family transcriptional regulator n=1 Tax=Spiroplasma endosymbiont of Tipula paludosa TaxID=3066295 RepID=UPI0035C8F0BE
MEINKIISQIKELATSTHNYALLANYIITNTQKVITFRINDLANKTYVSTSTVSRFVKLLGLSGYNEFQHVLKYYLHNIAGDYISHSSPDNKGDYIKTLYENTTKSLQDTHNIIDTKKIEQVSLYLTKTQEVILIAGQASYVPCLDLAEKLIRLGFNVKFSNNAYIQNTYCKLSSKNSLVIAVSYSGINFEVLRNLKIVKGNNSHIVTVTKRNKNEVNSYSDVALHVLSNESIERYVSLTSHLTLIYAELYL